MSKDNNSQDLLNDAIREASGASTTTRRTTPSRPAATASNADLRSVLNELGGSGAAAAHAASPAPVRSASSAAPPVGVTINDLIREANSGTSQPISPHAAAKSGPLAAANLSDVVQDVHATGALAGPDAGKGATFGTTLRRLGLAVLVVVLLTGGVVLWWLPTQLSGPAGTLQALNQAVEQYGASHNGELPKELSALAAFPKDAVEWPLRYWKARDAAGRTEVIWVPQRSGHYRIVLRQGKEFWTVSDHESKPKLIMKGTPSHD